MYKCFSNITMKFSAAFGKKPQMNVDYMLYLIKISQSFREPILMHEKRKEKQAVDPKIIVSPKRFEN